jgi:plastocyanin
MFGLSLLIMLPAEAASLSGVVTIDGHPVTGVIVYLEGVEESRSGSFASAPVVIEQRNLTFSPSVIPIVQGSSVVFTNNDSVPHGIYSPSGEAEKFNLGTYSHGEERRMVFSSPGEIILLCHIHPEMEARLLVFKDPYFATSAADGRYHVREVPPGKYLLRVWRPRQQTPADPLELSLAGDLTLDLRLNQ